MDCTNCLKHVKSSSILICTGLTLTSKYYCCVLIFAFLFVDRCCAALCDPYLERCYYKDILHTYYVCDLTYFDATYWTIYFVLFLFCSIHVHEQKAAWKLTHCVISPVSSSFSTPRKLQPTKPAFVSCFMLKINDERWSKLLWQNHALQMRSVTVGNRRAQTYRVGKTRQRTKTGRKPVKTKSSRVCTRCRSTSLSEGGHTL